MDNNFKQGSCEIIWKIENFSTSSKVYESPTFYLGNSRETKWYLSISSFSASVFFRLKSDNCSVNITVCCNASISCNGEIGKESNILTFPDKYSHSSILLFMFSPKKEIAFRNLLIQVFLRDISDLSFSLHRLVFRSVQEVETRKLNYDIPHFKELISEHIFIQVLPICLNSIHFEMKMWVTNEEDDVKTLHINVSESSKIKKFELFCKISAEDSNGKLISSATKFHLFLTTVDTLCSLEIHIPKDALKTFTSSNHALSLNCEFLTSEGKTLTWGEESTTCPVRKISREKISNKSFDMEKINLRDDFLCLYVEGKNTDAIISAKGRKFPVHKTILSARSPVFAAMFDVDMIEKENNLVEIGDIETEILDQMIVFMYSDILQTKEYGNILKLYEASDKYQVLTLKDKCTTILKNLMDTRNALEMLVLSDMHHDTELQKSVEVFICDHAKELFKTKEFEALMEEKPSLGCKVMHKFCLTNI